MSEPNTPAERAAFYLEQADAADAQAARCVDALTAEAFRKVAGEWRNMADQQRRGRLG